MPMELYVLSDVRSVSFEAWQEAIYAGGFPLRLSLDGSCEVLSGAVRGLLRDRKTVFQCEPRDIRDVIADCPEAGFGQRWAHALAFRWGCNVHDGVAAYIAGAAYAGAAGGVVFDCVEGKVISPERAGEIAREIERQIPLVEEAMRRVTEKFRA